MSAGTIGDVWESGSWTNTSWEADSWDDAEVSEGIGADFIHTEANLWRRVLDLLTQISNNLES